MKKLEMCPRPPRDAKVAGAKTAITIDPNLWDILQKYYQEGLSISHMVDSALWHFFGKPKLSFETKSETKPPKCCGEEP